MITIAPVGFAGILRAPNAEKLFAEYGEECSIPAIGQINPQPDLYEKLESNGAMRTFAAFQDSELIGFGTVLVYVVPHYGEPIATIESLFIAAEHRATNAGNALMEAIEHHAELAGAVVVLYSARVGSRLERLLTMKKDYERTNTVFLRKL